MKVRKELNKKDWSIYWVTVLTYWVGLFISPIIYMIYLVVSMFSESELLRYLPGVLFGCGILLFLYKINKKIIKKDNND